MEFGTKAYYMQNIHSTSWYMTGTHWYILIMSQYMLEHQSAELVEKECIPFGFEPKTLCLLHVILQGTSYHCATSVHTLLVLWSWLFLYCVSPFIWTLWQMLCVMLVWHLSGGSASTWIPQKASFGEVWLGPAVEAGPSGCKWTDACREGHLLSTSTCSYPVRWAHAVVTHVSLRALHVRHVRYVRSEATSDGSSFEK